MTDSLSEATQQSAITAPTQFAQADEVTFAYRRFGVEGVRPVVFFNHLAANLDNFDPAVLDGIAREQEVITFDNRGVGSTSGQTPKTIEAMADDAARFIATIHSEPVDILALSMGGMVAQELALRHPHLIHKLILVGTGPRGGKGINKVTDTTMMSILKAALTKSDPKEYIFFNRNQTGRAAAKAFLARLNSRTKDRDADVSIPAFHAQLKAISVFGKSQSKALDAIDVPTLVINGDNDIMVPTPLSYELVATIPGAELESYADSGHGSLFQYPDRFVTRVLEFLKQ